MTVLLCATAHGQRSLEAGDEVGVGWGVFAYRALAHGYGDPVCRILRCRVIADTLPLAAKTVMTQAIVHTRVGSGGRFHRNLTFGVINSLYGQAATLWSVT